MYTPDHLVSFVIERVLDDHPGGDLRWLDPACGDGAFLAHVVNRLTAVTDPDDLADAVRQQVFGFDIAPRACANARARLRAQVEQVAGPQADGYLDSNIVCVDFLTVAPARVGTFDLIVGNPPYVSATQLSGAAKESLAARFVTAWGRLDLYSVFFEHALGLLAPGGRLAFITPDKFLSAESARPLRAFIASGYDVQSVDRFDRHDLFGGVATVPAVTVIERPASSPKPKHRPTIAWWDVRTNNAVAQRASRVALDVPDDGRPWVSRRAGTRAQPAVLPLHEVVTRISAGLATGLNACFVLNAEAAATVEPELLRPAVRGRDIYVGSFADSGLQLVFPYTSVRADARPELVELTDYPRLGAHLAQHHEKLQQRHCVRVWQKAWHDLHDPVLSDLARLPKILVPDLARTSRFAYDPGTVVPLHSAYYLLPRPDSPIRPEVLVALLNSEELERLLMERAPIAKSGYRRLRAQFLRDLPIPMLSQDEQATLLQSSELEPALAERAQWALGHAA